MRSLLVVAGPIYLLRRSMEVLGRQGRYAVMQDHNPVSSVI